jgi:hypothetical protein
MASAPLEQEGGPLLQDVTKTSAQGTMSTVMNAEAPTEDIAASLTLLELEDFMMIQWMYRGGFDWKTTDNPGTALYSVDMHPNSNPITAYLMPIFNCWAGGIDVQTNIAGTGFNGGKIMVVVIPPNVDYKLYTLTDYCYFPYVLMDPKCQGAMNHPGSDERSTYFHWTESFKTGEFARINNKGGTILFVVFQKLTIANMQLDTINVAVSTRPSKTFSFSQPIPPRTNTIGDIMNLHLSVGNTDPISKLPLNQIWFSKEKVETWYSVDSLVDFHGHSNMFKDWYIDTETIVHQDTGTTASMNTKYYDGKGVLSGSNSSVVAYRYMNVAKDKTPRISIDSIQTEPILLASKLTSTSYTDTYDGMWPSEQLAVKGCALFSMEKVKAGVYEVAAMKPRFPQVRDTEYTQYQATLNNIGVKTSQNEFIAYFVKTKPVGEKTGSMITEEMRMQLFDLHFAGLPEDITPVFDIKEVTTGITVGRARLNRQGFLSANIEDKVLTTTDLAFVHSTNIKYYERIPDGRMDTTRLAQMSLENHFELLRNRMIVM